MAQNSIFKQGPRQTSSLTREDVSKDKVQQKGIQSKTNAYDKVSRGIELRKAQETYEKTGDESQYQQRAGQIEQRTLGGSTEKFGVQQQREQMRDVDLSRRVNLAQSEYEKDQSTENAQAIKDEIATGYDRYSEESQMGIQLGQMTRQVDVKEMTRQLQDVRADWLNDPANNTQAYKDQLSQMSNYYGENSIEGININQQIRQADERSATLNVQNAMQAYEEDPANNFEALQNAQNQLIEFYGSSENGIMAQQSLRAGDQQEQGRVDTEASVEFEAGAIGYDEYSQYLNATMTKYPEGSPEYMKYYQASTSLEFNHDMDQIMRMQYDSPPGQVQQSLKDFQNQFAEGSPAFNQAQGQVDQLEVYLRQQAFQDQLKLVNFARQGEVNELEAKMFMLNQDYASGEIDEDKYKKKYEKYQNKIDYLTDPGTLPQFEMWNTYYDDSVNFSDYDVYAGYDQMQQALKGNIDGVFNQVF